MRRPLTLQELLHRSSSAAPEHAVFIRRGRVTSYGELEEASGRLAACLVENGIGRGERVVLVLDNTVEYLIAYYGALKAGACIVPHYTDTRPATLGHIVSHCQARAMVLKGRSAELLTGARADLASLRLLITVGPVPAPRPALQAEWLALESCLAEASAAFEASGASSEDLATIVYTSGTTGRPKGVMLSQRNLVTNVLAIVEYLELSSADTVAMVLPFFYVYGNSVLHTHVAAGGTIAAVGTMAFPAAVLEGIQAHRCTGFSGVPSTFARLLQFSVVDRFDLSCLRYVTQAGGSMTPALTARLRQALPGARIFVMYGQTEAAARLTYLPPEDMDRKMGSAGKAIPGVTLTIMDKEGRELPAGEVGEIVARGDNIMRGYWQSPEETRRALRPEGLRTGDLAWMDEEGFIFIVGRESEMIKSGAHRIGPVEIEEVIEALTGVAECTVVGVADELLGEAIAVFVVLAPDAALTEQDILRHCNEHLPRFKMPSHVRLVSALPRTPAGKVRRRELRESFLHQREEKGSGKGA